MSRFTSSWTQNELRRPVTLNTSFNLLKRVKKNVQWNKISKVLPDSEDIKNQKSFNHFSSYWTNFFNSQSFEATYNFFNQWTSRLTTAECLNVRLELAKKKKKLAFGFHNKSCPGLTVVGQRWLLLPRSCWETCPRRMMLKLAEVFRGEKKQTCYYYAVWRNVRYCCEVLLCVDTCGAAAQRRCGCTVCLCCRTKTRNLQKKTNFRN